MRGGGRRSSLRKFRTADHDILRRCVKPRSNSRSRTASEIKTNLQTTNRIFVVDAGTFSFGNASKSTTAGIGTHSDRLSERRECARIFLSRRSSIRSHDDTLIVSKTDTKGRPKIFQRYSSQAASGFHGSGADQPAAQHHPSPGHAVRKRSRISGPRSRRASPDGADQEPPQERGFLGLWPVSRQSGKNGAGNRLYVDPLQADAPTSAREAEACV